MLYLPFEQSNGKADVGGVGGNDTPMDKIHQVEHTREEFVLEEIARVGARKMLAEVQEYVEALPVASEMSTIHALVVRKTAMQESVRSS